jgi:voltage-gated potassium channel
MLVSATALYLVEGPEQPDKFGSIPRALWWAAVTLTTIGYGDVFPVTPLGKLLAAMTAMAGIGLIAAPTGILAAAFSEAFQRQHHRRAAHDDAHAHGRGHGNAPDHAPPH